MELKPKKVYRYRVGNSVTRWKEIHDWCKGNLYHGGHYEPNWYTDYPWIVFTDEREYVMFLLKWGSNDQ